MGIGTMLKMTLTPTPRWIKRVEKTGLPATAVVVSDPKEVMKGVYGYSGKDGWVDLEADVLTEIGEELKAKVKCRLSQTFALEPGTKVNVRYDPEDKTRVVLVDDFQTLLNYRLKPE